MSATNTGWRLMILDAAQVNLTLETSPILMELVSPGPQGASAGGGNVNVVSGDGITVTESPADTFTVRANFGSAGNTVCQGNDARLSDARPPTAHGHVIGDVSGLQTALDAKAAASHSHAIADVTGLQTALDGKAASSHTHTASQISDSSAVGRSVLTAADAASALSDDELTEQLEAAFSATQEDGVYGARFDLSRVREVIAWIVANKELIALLIKFI